MNLKNAVAKRLFSLNFYKNLRLPLGEMSFTKDFVNETRGDIYPIIEKSNDTVETVCDNTYRVVGNCRRLIGRHLPYVSYEMTFTALSGKGGFDLSTPDGNAFVAMGNECGKIFLEFCEDEKVLRHDTQISFEAGISLVLTTRRDKIDCYIKKGNAFSYIRTFEAKCLEKAAHTKILENSTSRVAFAGDVTVSYVGFYVDCGISQADIRPIRYENGEIMVENGKVFLTLSIRMQEECFQGIFAWIPGTMDFSFAGALFYDAGDGIWGNDVAASMMYDRNEKVWKLWVCSFCHNHILGHACFDGDVRFGVNVLDITLMPENEKDGDITAFLGIDGDEDPDFIYDEKSGKWYMSICRCLQENDGRHYRYFFYESDNAFEGYKFMGRTDCGGAETGGSLLKIDGKYLFVCGSSFDARAEYRIYDLFDLKHFTKMKFDYDDGGFRGWGSIIPIKAGNRTRYYHLTFDRSGGSDYTWSYGNIYCFELQEN